MSGIDWFKVVLDSTAIGAPLWWERSLAALGANLRDAGMCAAAARREDPVWDRLDRIAHGLADLSDEIAASRAERYRKALQAIVSNVDTCDEFRARAGSADEAGVIAYDAASMCRSIARAALADGGEGES